MRRVLLLLLVLAGCGPTPTTEQNIRTWASETHLELEGWSCEPDGDCAVNTSKGVFHLWCARSCHIASR